MTTSDRDATTVSLDPADWEADRAVAHRMVDDMFDYLQSVRERPAWQHVPDEVRAALDENLPREGTPLAQVYDEFRERVLPYPTGNLHPRFFGWVMGNGTVTGMLGEMLMAGMNAHGAGYDQSALYVEQQVIRWLAQLVGYPQDASGILVSGGTMANLNGLAVARNEKAGFALRTEGLQSSEAPRFTCYGGSETHSWIYKACELMGLGRQAFRSVPASEDYTVDVAALRAMIEADIAAGDKPFCIIGTVGTVNTGAVDDIAALRTLADEFDCWLHVDGAFGSLAAWSERHRHLVEAQAQADSIAFDLHKWGYMPYEIGCVLTRSSDAQDKTYGTSASYLMPAMRGVGVNNTYFADRGIQLSRSFRALKAWMSMKQQGVDRIGAVIGQNIEQAQYLSAKVDAHPDLERLAPTSLNIVCFRHLADGYDEDALDRLNEELLMRVQESGFAVPSQTLLGGRFALRVCITNHRTTYADLDALIDEISRHARAIIDD
ncbi:pyridoxal-dependent decarboxylase [Altererythrobacter arenosus]|uniref:Pyridoxal-dependent decarboxylase n=1 Tax=Altererythrobacter arenosus TaxID=3032592 RepID=A0ABY8FYM1_9SPHN|nr:pyridoxal-dependent decarboxylase [Altererythrobacter sp. CAU 1644]WFL78381.1 pyridoxal-dependent decarboxylase [Altererythrobacter sp. CAU 1644]